MDRYTNMDYSKKELDAEAMDQLVTLSACFHTRRVDYLQMFTTSESLLGKFYHTWTKSTREATEKFENMFCSQFAALMVMVWDGSLQMNRDKTITPVNTSAVRMHFAGARELLPGDFDPGDVLRIENGHFDETYQLQIPYDHYQKYDDLAARQEAESLFVRGQTKNDLMRTCLAKLPSVEYVNEHLPTFAHKMQEWLHKHTCDTKCGAYHMELPAKTLPREKEPSRTITTGSVWPTVPSLRPAASHALIEARDSTRSPSKW
ncbi:unnamed protein product [Symbiodinium natans]|uniref:Uncharacterized protein n=1 Tax=Symbiodinium natans TaxID=878477 RepID=A0A812QGA9_9DINO|nr:unnamed protein product [Symbiodinium natans]